MKIIALSIVILLVSCSSSQLRYYSLSGVKQPNISYQSKSKSIGVEQVIMPAYLSGRNISIELTNNQIKRLSNVQWADDLDSDLTQRLIAFLQNNLAKSSVHLYPWDTDTSPDIKLTLHITRFIALQGQVHLQANWIIGSLNSVKNSKYSFNTMVATNMRVDDIVRAMSDGFSQLQDKIALALTNKSLI